MSLSCFTHLPSTSSTRRSYRLTFLVTPVCAWIAPSYCAPPTSSSKLQVLRVSEQGDVRAGLQCANAGCTAIYSVDYLKNRVTLEARKAIHQYYSCKLHCCKLAN